MPSRDAGFFREPADAAGEPC